VGYVSSNVHAHIGSAVLRPLFALHDRAAVEVIVYAASPVEDQVSAELKPLADLWVPSATLDDAAFAARIRADRIDVVIHSMGSWPDHRLGVLAHRAAPVQVECISQSPAICMAECDANIVDPWLAADGLLGRLSGDRIVELPSGYFTTSMLPDKPIAPAPRHRGGPRVVLGSFNRLAKISPGTIRRWARVMAELPDAPLIVKGPEKLDDGEVARMRAAWRDLGIDPSRVEFRGHAEGEGYWDHFADVDLLLDSLPFNGGRTTTCGAWMGVPTISERVRPPYGRLGDCILSRLGCADLVADDADGYVAKAVALARDPARLDAYRAGLRGRFAQSTLLESPHYVRELEAALRMLWREWCTSSPSDAGR
jgi:predicted O-linked N-acetylglucosamine transferase (SPINDLY family)